jgi:septal ring factor EnvC (AmiA/AmiB activator)
MFSLNCQSVMRKLSQWKMSNEIGYNTDNSFSRRRIMLGTDIRGIMAEEEEVLRRRQALKSLLSMRTKQLRESLEQRIKRAKNGGDWMQLSREAHLKSQLEQLQHEDDRTRGKLTLLKRAKARAQRIRAAEAASGRKRR